MIRLDPARLSNPDLDLRYEIPDRLCERSGGRICDDGYDYEDTEARAGQACLLVFLRTEDLAAAVPEVLAMMHEERLLGNDLGAAAEVSVCDGDDDVGFRVVFPDGTGGEAPA